MGEVDFSAVDSEEQHDTEADEKSCIVHEERLHLPELLAVL